MFIFLELEKLTLSSSLAFLYPILIFNLLSTYIILIVIKTLIVLKI